jgi:tetratricopeptide (TPR) repeat protein
MTRVSLFEKHDAAYAIWRRAGAKDRVLVHVDAHHDMWWIPEDVPTSIGDFICPSLKSGIVRQIFWVVPDRTWELRTSRKGVVEHVRRLTRTYPDSRMVARGNRSVSALVLGRPLTVCAVDGLPALNEDVLLDVDVDYFVIPHVTYGERDAQASLPWCWPDQLLARLDERGVRSDIATIAYSVEGGYTPLKWKYLGDEVAERLTSGNPRGASLLRAMELIRAGALAAAAGDRDVAERTYLESVDVLPDFAASHYHLALLCLEMDRVVDARQHYARAVAADSSYRSGFDTAGLLYQSMRDFRDVESRLREALRLDPTNAYAHYGVGRIALSRKQWAEAELSLRQSLSLDSNLIDAHRALGWLLARQRRYDEALASYACSMKASLAGGAPLAGPILTNEGEGRGFRDPHHWHIHARLARLHELKGEVDQAIAGYRLTIAGGYDRLSIRARLAYLYLGRRQWRKSARELAAAMTSAPRELRRAAKNVHRKLTRA